VPQTNPVPNQGLGLLVALHGSSASSYAQFATEMAPIAQSYGLMIASVLAPNGSGWNEGNQQSNAQYLHNLIQNEIYRLYNIDTRKVIFSGQSSGGGFLGSHFIPLFGENYQGGAFLQCGVQPPFRAFTASARMQQSFQIHIEITTGETIWRQFFNPAIQSYQQAGLQVSSRSDRPGGHCQFSQSEVIQSQIRRFLPAL
jgi:poly(3-hydroxybutyrate) depolymerase